MHSSNQSNATHQDKLATTVAQLIAAKQFAPAKALLCKSLQQQNSPVLRAMLYRLVQEQPATKLNAGLAEWQHLLPRYWPTICQKAAEGWRYATCLDAEFLAQESTQVAVSHAAADKSQTTHTGGTDNSQAPARAQHVLDELLAEPDLTARWQRAIALAESKDAVQCVDDFARFKPSALRKALIKAQRGKQLNVTILGAGSVGLTLANMLKHALGQGVQILVIETRVNADHYKKPYTRSWLTQLGKGLLAGRIDPSVEKLLNEFGAGSYLGCTIAVLEALLLAANRDQGVRFLFQGKPDLSFLNDSDTHLVFDASGGRLSANSNAALHLPSPTPEQIQIDLPAIAGYSRGFQEFGITPNVDAPAMNMQLHASIATQRRPVSYYGVSPASPQPNEIAVSMLKIIGIPCIAKAPLQAFIGQQNADHRFYLWQGKLQTEINSMMLFINLDAETYKALGAHVSASMTPTAMLSLIETLPAGSVPDTIINLLSELVAVDIECKATVEPPFVYQPYIQPPFLAARTCHGRPIIPVGDSLYNGHPKVGNGLGFHLRYIGQLVDDLISCCN